MDIEIEKNYLFIKYVQQSIKNASNAFYQKKQIYSTRFLLIDVTDNMMNTFSNDNYLNLDSVKNTEIDKLENFIDNQKLSFAIEQLSYKDKHLLYEKYINCKTDNEIALKFGISRQGISIAKKRILKKIKKLL